jgi:hypothetical protein
MHAVELKRERGSILAASWEATVTGRIISNALFPFGLLSQNQALLAAR